MDASPNQEKRLNSVINCPAPQDLLAFLAEDGDLSIDRKADIAAHTQVCDSCAEILTLFTDDRFDNPTEYAMESERIFQQAEYEAATPPPQFSEAVGNMIGEKSSTPHLDALAPGTERSEEAEKEPYEVIIRYAAAVILGITAMLWLFLSGDQQPDRALIANIEVDEATWQNIRSENSTNSLATIVQNGHKSGDRNGYREAAEALAAYLQDEFRSYHAWLHKGIFHLLLAQHDASPENPVYDAAEIDQAIVALEKALSFSDDNLYYQQDALYYLAKGQMMRKDMRAARQSLQTIIDLPEPALPHKQAAQNILDQMSQ